MLGWTPGSRDRGGPSQSRVLCVLYDLGLLLHLSARVHTHTHIPCSLASSLYLASFSPPGKAGLRRDQKSGGDCICSQGWTQFQHLPPVALAVPSYLPRTSVSPSLDVGEVCVKHGDQYLAQSGHSANMSW